MKEPTQNQGQEEQLGEQLYSLTPVKQPQGNISPQAVLPTWIRLPKSGQQCEHSGLSRSGMNELILGPDAPVKSVSLRKRYALRGTRLIHLQSLLSYLDAEAKLQATKNKHT